VPDREGEYSVDPITRKDLDEALEKTTKDIKEFIHLLIAPMLAEQKAHRTILTGQTGMNGLVGKLKTLDSRTKVIYGLLAFVSAAVAATVVKQMFF